jgi:hypothetical protein
VFDSIISGPRFPDADLALEGSSLDAIESADDDDEILGEIDDDPDDGEITVLATGEDLLRIQREWNRNPLSTWRS